MVKQIIGKDNYDILKNIKMRKVKVNDKYYDCKLGLKSSGGFYKNGFTAEVIEGKNKEHNYIVLKIYTSVNHTIDIEEKWLIRDDGKVCKRFGWNNVNLLPLCNINECLDNMNCLLREYK